MKSVVVILGVLALTGCGRNDSEEMGKAMNQLRDNCRGTLTVELQYGQFNGSHLKASCSEDVSDEARAKKAK